MNGNTSHLTASFIQGAKEAGHSVEEVKVGFSTISGCHACEYCHSNGNKSCIIKDDMISIYPKIVEAEMLVLASPIYYFTLSGQLQNVLHRTYALGKLTNIKKTVLILSSGSKDVYDSAISQYKQVVKWWGSTDMGIFAIPGIQSTHAPINITEENLKELYEFKKSLR